MMSEDEKPFGCSSPGCGMRFTNEDHLTVHLKKHEMCLALNSGNNSRTPNNLFLDQTPTPTKFLKNCEEIGLFQDLTKNPFEEAFKKASETGGPDVSSDSVPLPGPHSNDDLHTPVVSRPHKTVETLKLENEEIEIQVVDESSNEATSRSCVIQRQLEDKRASHGGSSMATPPPPPPPASASGTVSATHSMPQPTSTTSDDDGVIMSTIQNADSSVPSTDSATTSSAGSIPSVIQTSSAPILSPNIISSTQYTMQVYLQLPTGQTVPVQIPATITNSAMPMASIPVPTISPKSSSSATVASAAAAATTSSSSGLSQPSLAKQKLKAVLQSSQNVPQDLTTSNNSRLVDSANNHISQMASPSPSSVSVKTETASIASDATASSPESLDAAIIGGGVIKRPKRSGEDDPDERRRKFLERNRAAAARCRQKRKQWITNLEKKAEELQNTNSRLQSEVNLLRTEVAQLKSLLLAHKDCPITLQQKSMGQLSIQTVPMTAEAPNIIISSTAISAGENIVSASLPNVIASSSSSSSAPVSSSTPSTNFSSGGIATTVVIDRSNGNSINSKNSNSLMTETTILSSSPK